MKGYFDNNATTPLSSAAREAWTLGAERYWHNPSSLYREAAAASRQLEDSREELADLLECEPEQLVFTSGATEANNAVFRQLSEKSSDALAYISAVEHPSVRVSASLRFGPDRVEEIPVASGGAIDPDWLADRFQQCGEEEKVALVSVMAANNETGVLQPWQEVSALCREKGVPFHCDAAQWVGKQPAKGLGDSDYLTGCAHKFGGPKGTGFLKLPDSADHFEIFTGGPQENGHRAGTEDLPGILGMMAALREKPDTNLESAAPGRIAERRTFESAVLERIPGSRIVAPDSPRLWNTVMVVIPEHKNLKWLTRLNLHGFAVSTGSACSAGKGKPSHVMAAMGLDHEEMGRVIRVSGGWDTTAEDWIALADAFADVAAELATGKRTTGTLLA